MHKYLTEYINKDGLLFEGPEIIAKSEKMAEEIASTTGLNQIKVVGRLVKPVQWGQRADIEMKPYKGGGL